MKSAIYYRSSGVIQQVCTGPEDVVSFASMDGLEILVVNGIVDVAGKHVVVGDDGPELADGILDTRTLAEAKAAKRQEVNARWSAADADSFVYAGKPIACDPESRKHIETTNGCVVLTGSLPSGWPGAWKAKDNTLAQIANRADWEVFYSAMVAQGMANFQHAQNLKAAIDAAQTIAAVDALNWDSL